MSHSDAVSRWTPPPRPDWVQRINDEGRHMDIASLVPLDPQELKTTETRVSLIPNAVGNVSGCCGTAKSMKVSG